MFIYGFRRAVLMPLKKASKVGRVKRRLTPAYPLYVQLDKEHYDMLTKIKRFLGTRMNTRAIRYSIKVTYSKGILRKPRKRVALRKPSVAQPVPIPTPQEVDEVLKVGGLSECATNEPMDVGSELPRVPVEPSQTKQGEVE